MFIPSNRLRSVLRWLAGSDGDHVGYLKMSAHRETPEAIGARQNDEITLMSDIGAPLLQMPGNEGRNGFRFIGRKVVIAAGDNMQLGIRHAAFEMEPNANRADRTAICHAREPSRLSELNFSLA
ncbi:MAG TPA: hypothetical protein VEN78_40545 [Bradyrhizobium sp.]|nr:hypothetical protein [Bradyrhizobium sp.]